MICYVQADVSTRLPHRGIAVFLFAAGLVVLPAWLSDIVSALVRGRVPPLLASYTTMVTYVVDLGIIAPAVFLAGVLLLRRAPLGHLLASTMLILNAIVGMVVVAQTVAQLLAGVSFSIGGHHGAGGPAPGERCGSGGVDCRARRACKSRVLLRGRAPPE